MKELCIDYIHEIFTIPYTSCPQLFQLVTKANLAQYTKKCEDIFFLEPFYFVTIFLPRSFLKISEGHLQNTFEVENHLNPPKQQNHKKTKKKGSEHASLDILKASILIIFSHFFQVGAVHTNP